MRAPNFVSYISPPVLYISTSKWVLRTAFTDQNSVLWVFTCFPLFCKFLFHFYVMKDWVFRAWAGPLCEGSLCQCASKAFLCAFCGPRRGCGLQSNMIWKLVDLKWNVFSKWPHKLCHTERGPTSQFPQAVLLLDNRLYVKGGNRKWKMLLNMIFLCWISTRLSFDLSR